MLSGKPVQCCNPSECPEIHSVDPQTLSEQAYGELSTLWGDSPSDFVLGYCDHMGYSPIVIVPSGSDLYNTALPDVPRHDFDFVIFVNEDWDCYRHATFGPVDMFLVPVALIPKYLSQSQVAEALFGYHHGHAVFVDEDVVGTIAEMSEDAAMVYVVGYCDKSREHVRKHADRAYPAKRLDREFKHCRRWVRYLDRGASGIPDPRLSDEERSLWLKDIAQKPVFEEE